MKTARRKRTEKEAVQYFNDNTPQMRPEDRKTAKARIRFATQPNVEAQRIVDQANKAKIRSIVVADEIDLSDVQVLRVQLIRRDGLVSSPHLEMLASLERNIVTNGVTGEEFKQRAAYILSIESAVPENIQRLEKKFNRLNQIEVD
jgi:hypothetical protein